MKIYIIHSDKKIDKKCIKRNRSMENKIIQGYC